ncbi:MAG: hypothetical protein AB2784_21415 [Candidatus Thiodiazotropha endolucinida]
MRNVTAIFRNVKLVLLISWRLSFERLESYILSYSLSRPELKVNIEEERLSAPVTGRIGDGGIGNGGKNDDNLKKLIKELIVRVKDLCSSVKGLRADIKKLGNSVSEIKNAQKVSQAQISLFQTQLSSLRKQMSLLLEKVDKIPESVLSCCKKDVRKSIKDLNKHGNSSVVKLFGNPLGKPFQTLIEYLTKDKSGKENNFKGKGKGKRD